MINDSYQKFVESDIKQNPGIKLNQLHYPYGPLGLFYDSINWPYEYNQEFIHRPLMKELRENGLLFEINMTETWAKLIKLIKK